MIKKAAIVVAVALVFAVVALYAGDWSRVNACSSKSTETVSAGVTADAHPAGSCCAGSARAAALVAANAHACCRGNVSTAAYASSGHSCPVSASIASGHSCPAMPASYDLYACKNGGHASAATNNASSCSKSASSCSKSASSASLAVIPYKTGQKVELTGSVVCGHCDMGATEHCQAVFKTADGKAYLLFENDAVKTMEKADAKDGFKIVTRVREVDGTKYLDVQKYEAL